MTGREEFRKMGEKLFSKKKSERRAYTKKEIETGLAEYNQILADWGEPPITFDEYISRLPGYNGFTEE